MKEQLLEFDVIALELGAASSSRLPIQYGAGRYVTPASLE
jgi:hypothetical protein